MVFSRLTSRSVARFLLPDDWSVYFAIYVCLDWPNFITDCSQERLLSLVNYRQKIADNVISGLFLVLLFLGVCFLCFDANDRPASVINCHP